MFSHARITIEAACLRSARAIFSQHCNQHPATKQKQKHTSPRFHPAPRHGWAPGLPAAAPTVFEGANLNKEQERRAPLGNFV